MIVPYTITSKELSKVLGASHHGNDMPIQHVTTDSRKLQGACLFIPIVGQKFDGHDFIEDVCKSGMCASFLTHRKEYIDVANRYNVSAVHCADTLKAFLALAQWHRRQFNLPVVGITGTNGKTTTKEMIAHVLSKQGECCKTQKNYNNEIGVPYTVLHLNATHTYAVIEMGMNHGGEIERLSKTAMPTIGMITSIGEGHLEFLGTTENVAHAKSEILDGMEEGSIFLLNSDTKHVDIPKKKALQKKIPIITYGLSGQIQPSSYTLHADKTIVSYEGIDFSVGSYGLHNIYSMLGTIAVAKVMGLSLHDVKDAMEDFAAVSMRSDIKKGKCTIIDDSYNSNPLSLEYALRSAMHVFPDKRKIAVLSDMKEMGVLSQELHYEAGTKLAPAGFSELFVWGNDARYYADGAAASAFDRSRIRIFDEKEELIKNLIQCIHPDDVVLVKGSRSMKMEDVVKALE